MALGVAVLDGVASGVGLAVAVAVGTGNKAVAASFTVAAAAAAGIARAGCFCVDCSITAEAAVAMARPRCCWPSSRFCVFARSASALASRSSDARSEAETFPRAESTRTSCTCVSAWRYWISIRLSPRESVYSSRSFASLKL